MKNKNLFIGSGGVIGAPFGIYYGIILGTLGGGWGEHFLGRLGIPIGIVLAFVVVTGVFVGLGALVGKGICYLWVQYYEK